MSGYIPPEEVTSPRRNWSLIRVLERGHVPDSHGQRVAISIGTWNNKTVLGMRWNGDEERPNGHPQSRGLPVWFIVPRRLQDAVIDTLSKDDQALAKSLLNSAKK